MHQVINVPVVTSHANTRRLGHVADYEPLMDPHRIYTFYMSERGTDSADSSVGKGVDPVGTWSSIDAAIFRRTATQGRQPKGVFPVGTWNSI